MVVDAKELFAVRIIQNAIDNKLKSDGVDSSRFDTFYTYNRNFNNERMAYEIDNLSFWLYDSATNNTHELDTKRIFADMR